jgi:hypothetical protein
MLLCLVWLFICNNCLSEYVLMCHAIGDSEIVATMLWRAYMSTRKLMQEVQTNAVLGLVLRCRMKLECDAVYISVSDY